MASTAIIGGGISGLTAAYFLNKSGIPFTLFEASDSPGGKIKSTKTEGFLVELGPNSLQTTTPLLNQIIEETGLSAHQVFADGQAKKRFIVKQGRPRALPTSPPAALTSGFFSLKSRLGLLKEPLVSRGKAGQDESVAHFIQRRLGSEVLDYAVDPFVTGIFAGNPLNLSLKHAFPALYRLEKDHGSLLRGLLASKRRKSGSLNNKTNAERRIFSFRDGMEMLPAGIANQFRDKIKLSSKVIGISSSINGWQIEATTSSAVYSDSFDAVINTLPLPAFSSIDTSYESNSDLFARVDYPPVTVMAMGFHKDDVDHPLDGFGMLVPHKESGVRILGTIFSSTVFPGRAPSDHVLLTTLVGGARKGDLCTLPKDLLEDFVLDDLFHLLGVHGKPVFIRQIDWTKAIPQYNIGYGEVKQAIADLEAGNKGLYFAGNYRCGISVGQAMESGHHAAQQVIQYFESN